MGFPGKEIDLYGEEQGVNGAVDSVDMQAMQARTTSTLVPASFAYLVHGHNTLIICVEQLAVNSAIGTLHRE